MTWFKISDYRLPPACSPARSPSGFCFGFEFVLFPIFLGLRRRRRRRCRRRIIIIMISCKSIEIRSEDWAVGGK